MTPQRHRWLRILTWADISLATIAQRLTTELESHERLAQTGARHPPSLSHPEQATIREIARLCREGMSHTDRLANALVPPETDPHTPEQEHTRHD